MRKHFLLAVLGFSLVTNICKAQNSIITEFAGTGSTGWSGDGGPATAAAMGVPYGIAFDATGNMYVVDNNNGVVRKIDNTGTITTVAGNGAVGNSGDGGPATDAATNVGNIAVDAAGNIYIADGYYNVVRKVSTSGIITSIAGTGGSGYSGDGGPATDAQMTQTFGIVVDGSGNVYFSDYSNNVIRKINTSGIITTVAGNGVAGFSGDGGPATAAQLYSPRGLAMDAAGNIYVADVVNYRVRKINTSGVISTFAGTGFTGFSGDGGPAVNAQIAGAFYVAASNIGDVYITDPYNNRVRKVNAAGIISTVAGVGTSTCAGIGGSALAAGVQPIGIGLDQARNFYITDDVCYKVYKIHPDPTVVSDSFWVYIDNLCNGVSVTAVASSTSTLNLQISYGDNFSSTTPFSMTTSGDRSANVVHSYANPGTYTMRMVLLNGTTPIDTAKYSYSCLLCNTLPVKFYYDANSNCEKDGTDPDNYLPITTEVDSNGIAVDTISATAGFDYTAYGSIGDIYTFRVLSTTPGMVVSCPVSGVITDTLQAGAYNTSSKDIALSCSAATGFDLVEYAGSQGGRHMFSGDIIVNNTYCNATNATLTALIDTKYNFVSSYPPATSVTGGTATWDLANVAATTLQPHIHFTCEVPGAWLTPGDTISTHYDVTPVTGDMIPGNNHCVEVDTVKSSYDPNEMTVSPAGYIPAGTTLQYTIEFENTGNDTAHNIYVMDTLNSALIPGSLRILASSATMNVIPIRVWGHNIIKFDFPGIQLQDSTHHDQCTGKVIFTINTSAGLPDGTTIFNEAGIYFDDNPVVMTNTVENIIGIPNSVSHIYKTPYLQIFPNPATDELTISMDKDAYNSFTITNSVGQELIQQTLSNTQTKVNVKSLPAGLYYITVRGENGSKVQKFVKR